MSNTTWRPESLTTDKIDSLTARRLKSVERNIVQALCDLEFTGHARAEKCLKQAQIDLLRVLGGKN